MLTDLIACLLRQPIKTLEQPMYFTAPLGVWAW